MLPPKPRLLSVMEIVDQPQASKSPRTDARYPQRRSLERAVQSFIIYLVVASRFSDGTETKGEANSKRPSAPAKAGPKK